MSSESYGTSILIRKYPENIKVLEELVSMGGSQYVARECLDDKIRSQVGTILQSYRDMIDATRNGGVG